MIEKNEKINHTSTLSHMYVSPSYTGRGIAKKLIEFSIDYCKKNSILSLYLGCNANNTKALNLYKKSGFKIVGTFRNYRRDDNKFSDHLVMLFDLSS